MVNYCRECRYYIALMDIFERFGQCILLGKDIEVDRKTCFMFERI